MVRGGMDVILIAAVAHNNVIGQNGKLPWHYPEDLKRFKDLTKGHPVIMGRKTYESIPEMYRPLSDRLNIVLSSSKNSFDDGSYVCNSLESALNMLALQFPFVPGIDYSRVFVAGGVQVYQEAMSYATILEITRLHKPYAGDVFFPLITTCWEESNRIERGDYSFVTYLRKGDFTW